MSRRTQRAALVVLSLALSAGSASAQMPVDTINFDQTMTLDPVGNATGRIRFSLSARQFGQWFAKYGQNQSLLRRDVGKVLSQYETSDWDVQIRQMEREVTVSFRAKGTVTYRGDGTFEYRVPKTWKSAGVSGQTVNYNYVEPMGGTLATYSIHIVTPPKATNLTETTGDTGEQVVQYKLPVASYTKPWMAVTGGTVLLLGLGVTATGLFVRPRSATPPGFPPPPVLLPAPPPAPPTAPTA